MPSTTRSTRIIAPLPAGLLLPFRELLLAARSQSTAFEKPGCFARPRGTTPATMDLPRLATTFTHAVTLLERVNSRNNCRMSPVPRSIVSLSAPAVDAPAVSKGFRGAETRSSPLPFDNGFFAVWPRVSAWIHQQALSGISWLSFSLLDFFHPITEDELFPGSPYYYGGSSPRWPR
jgi:hypothetical protein